MSTSYALHCKTGGGQFVIPEKKHKILKPGFYVSLCNQLPFS